MKTKKDFKQISEQVEELHGTVTELYHTSKKLTEELYDIRNELDTIKIFSKRLANEEQLDGNIHKNCQYYHIETDACYNYMMGTGLAFEVSRLSKCIKNILEVELDD